MKAIYNTTYFIAGEIDALKNDLNAYRLSHKQVLGKYTMGNGEVVLEPAFCVITDNEALINSLAFKYNQESVLKLDGARNATILYTDGRQSHIGVFKPASESIAKSKEAYTLDESTGVYYVCEK